MQLLTKMTLDKLRELRTCSQKAKALEVQAAELRQRQHQLEGDLGSLFRTLDIAGDEIPPEEREEVDKARMELNEPVVPKDETRQHEDGGDQQEDLGAKTGAMYAVTALQQLGHPADTKILLAKMQEIGFRPRAANPYVSLFSTLRRSAQRPDSRIDKREGLWGLRDWPKDVWAQVKQGRSRYVLDVEDLEDALESEG
jgi:hypothetical protein